MKERNKTALQGHEIGRIKHNACKQEVIRAAEEIGFSVYSSDKVEDLPTVDYDVIGGKDLRFAISAGRMLGSKIVEDIFIGMYNNGIDPADFALSVRDVDGINKINVTTTHKGSGAEKSFTLNMRVKSKTGARMTGLKFDDNISFLESLFANTPLLRSGVAVKMADDTVGRSAYNESVEAGCHLGERDSYVREKLNLGAGVCWKFEYISKLVGAIVFTLNQPTFVNHAKQFLNNVLNMAGFESDVHFATALRKSDNPTTHLYTSINCDKYAKIINREFKTLKIIIRKRGGFFIELDKFRIGFDYVPLGMSFMTNPINEFVVNGANSPISSEDSILTFSL